MSPSEIQCKTSYTTPDGLEFDDYDMAEHHCKVINVLTNCFFQVNKADHYSTIWELLKHSNVVSRDDEEYNLWVEGDFEGTLDESYITNKPSKEQIQKLFKRKTK